MTFLKRNKLLNHFFCLAVRMVSPPLPHLGCPGPTTEAREAEWGRHVYLPLQIIQETLPPQGQGQGSQDLPWKARIHAFWGFPGPAIAAEGPGNHRYCTEGMGVLGVPGPTTMARGQRSLLERHVCLPEASLATPHQQGR